jgi:hypothetical protein
MAPRSRVRPRSADACLRRVPRRGRQAARPQGSPARNGGARGAPPRPLRPSPGGPGAPDRPL